MSTARVRVVDGAVEIDVPIGAAQGDLRIASDGARRVRIALEGRALAFARVLPGWRGFAWAHAAPADARLAIVDPIAAADARATATDAWPSRFADALLRSRRAWLRPGTWRLSPIDVAPSELPSRVHGLADPLAQATAFVESYRLNGSGRVVALRAASRPTDARVKSWRKHARDGTLPPVLLGWIGALDAYVVLDGHDRLLAASLEHVAPEAVALFGIRDDTVIWSDADRARARRDALGVYDRVFAAEPRLSDRTRLHANTRLVGAWSDHFQRRSWTPATFRPDLAACFASELADRDLPADVRAALLA